MFCNGNDRRIGETFFLQWTTYADSCTPSGGAPGDGWGGTSFTGFSARSQAPYALTVTTPGTNNDVYGRRGESTRGGAGQVRWSARREAA